MTRPDFDPGDYVYGAALVGAAANVIMQLGLPPVGRGVYESPVESGRADRHPIKRGRTTLSYLAVAMLGTEEERASFRRAVNRSHAQVRSTPDSPVPYNAFDPQLQLWVAACLYRGFLDVIDAMQLDIDVVGDERFYQYAARLGTTLQVKPEMWPADVAAFWAYWDRTAAEITYDDDTRGYLHRLASFAAMPRPISSTVGRLQLFLTRGMLPPAFRDAMGYTWDERDQARFDRIMRQAGWISQRLPGVLRRFPLNLCLWDVRRRLNSGHSLV
ncbi:MAG: DUF2236 domain-containing protein [Frankiaceae bacterium]|nr:DUF2236 domain-containing protein [Frankiaceae bacterium]MBV9870100.1 DUF2236 domain-containing protein [Frankiaceae bacterium]